MPPQGQSPETNENLSVWRPSLTRACFDQDECSAELGSRMHTRPVSIRHVPRGKGKCTHMSSASSALERPYCSSRATLCFLTMPWNSVGELQAMEFSLGSGVWTSSPALEQSSFLSPGPAVAHWLTHCPGQWTPRTGFSSVLRPQLHRLLSAVVTCVLLCYPLTQCLRVFGE